MKVFAGFSNEVVVLTSDKKVAVEAMARHHIVAIKLFDSEYEAYCVLARNLIITYGLGTAIPKFEDLMTYGIAEYTEKIPPQVWGYHQRFFAIVSNVGSAIATNVQFVFEFLSAYENRASYIEIREFRTQDEANRWRNCMYVQLIAPFLPYFCGTYPIISRAELNTTTAIVDYKKVLEEQRSNIPEKLFQAYTMPSIESVNLLPNLLE